MRNAAVERICRSAFGQGLSRACAAERFLLGRHLAARDQARWNCGQRQFLLSLLADPPQRSSRSGPVTATAAAAVLIASITILALGAA